MGTETHCFTTTVYAYVNGTLNSTHSRTTCITINTGSNGEQEAIDWIDPGDGGGGAPLPENTVITTHLDTTMSDDFYADERLRCIMEKLMSDGFFKNTLNKFIGENKPIDLNFRLSSTMDPLNLGSTRPVPLEWNAKNIEIWLNANELPDHPSIQWALTLLHEGVHAEMFRVF
ncbi:hypothetical protein ACFOET_04855 [Parapedobacter deserti]|uniref:Uncharacterized protein n=1 Tax=Parapedobacter deserti TaxID=1912957 RepID=A0ABV7JFW2_9SPHI